MSTSPSATPVIALHQLGYRYRRFSQAVLDDVSISLHHGEFVGVLGRNGAGKSTFLRALAGLLSPSSGWTSLAGQPMANFSPREVARQLAYVPQHKVDSFDYSVRQLVAMGRVPHRGVLARLTTADWQWVDEAIERMGLTALSQRAVTSLSGGERQRVNIARALAQQAQVILLDEPMAGLDPGSQASLMTLLKALARKGRTIVMTSHYPEELFAHASRVVILKKGRISVMGPPDEVINHEQMSLLYGTRMAQIDHAGRRFFYPEGSADTHHKPLGNHQ